jgi:hypothetical protein
MRDVHGEFYSPSNRNQIKHITRLEALQVAIDDNLKKLLKSNPEKKVGIVAFNQLVRVLGDGRMDPEIKIIDAILDSKDEIKAVAERTESFASIGEPGIMEKLRNKLLKYIISSF